MRRIPGGRLGLRVIARPQSGPGARSGAALAGYQPAEFQAEPGQLAELVRADETVWLDIVLRRRVDRNAFRFALSGADGVDFKRTQPIGAPVS